MDKLDFSQILGMIIAFFAVSYTVGSYIYDLFLRNKTPPPLPPRKSQASIIKERVDIDVDEEESLQPPPAPLFQTDEISAHPEQRFTFQSSLDHFKQKSAVGERQFDVYLRKGDELISGSIQKFGVDTHFQSMKKESRIQHLLKKFPSKKACIIAKEIIDPPLGLR